MVLTIMEAKGKDAWGLLLVLLLGQLVAFSMAVSSFTSSLIATLGVDAPLTQSFFAYLLLTLVYVPILLKRRKKLQIPWYWYLALAFIDVQGNYLVVKAYQYSYITSVTLLDCWTVVWVVILTWYALGTRYSFWQFVGAGTCVAGLALVLLSDSKSADAQDPSKIPLLGDALVIAGTIFFAFSNVGEEYCVKKKDRVEFVAMFALFGLLLCLFAGFAVALFMFYSITPFVLKMSGSTLFNLSLLTSDMWAVAIRVLFYHQQINWLYYIAFAVVAIGLIIYSLNDHSSDSGTRTTASTEAAAQYRQLPGEDNSTGISSNDSQERKQEEERAEKIRRSRKAIIPEGVLHHFLPPLKARERLMKTKSGPRSMMFLVFLGQLVSFSMAMPWYWYLALAFIDVQGNCLAIKAYHYSYITSVNLLNCWTITWVMILTRFALGTRYSLWQFVGAGTCMTGLALVLRSDSNYSDVQDESKRPLLGDALIIVATFCFAFSNVGEEYCVKNKDRIEFVAMLGIFGMLIGLFVGFAVASLVFSSIAPFVLKVNWLYYLAFAVVAIGLIIYSINESSDDETAASTMETETQYDYEQLSCE
uniref:EamA domain-containing protein n=1 Tax=Oryza meridionalis TaxID=40149 RepID=A0A0E0DS50_9ORYZ